MRHARVLIPLLVLATVLVDLALLSTVASAARPQGHPLWFVFVSLPMSQVGLLAVWAAMGRTPAPWRAAGLAVLIALWSKALAALQDGDRVTGTLDYGTIWNALLLLESVGIVLVLGLARAAGLDLTGGPAGRQTGIAATRARFQFSLGYLFSWLTAVAIALGALGYTFHASGLPRNASTVQEITAIAGYNVLLGLAAFVGLLGCGHWLVRGMVLAAAVVASMAGMSWTVPRGHAREWWVLCGCVAVWVLASLAVVRVAGYRLARRGGMSPGQSPGRAGG